MTGRLLKDSTIIIGSTLLANLMAYVYHLYVGRALGPVGYGILGSLLAVLSILTVPTSVLTLVITRSISESEACGRYDIVAGLLRGFAGSASKYGIPGLVLLLLASPLIARFLQLPSYTPAAILVMGLAVLIALDSLRSVLAGLQRFIQLGLNYILEAASRLLLAGLLVSVLGLGVNGSLLAYFLGYLIAAAVIAPSLGRVFGRQKATTDTAPFHSYFRPTAVMTVCLVIMTNASLVLVKHFFNPVQAGHYAALATMVSPVYMLGGAVSAVLYPAAAAAGAKGERSAPILRTGMAYVAAVSLAMTLAYFLFPSLIIAAMFGPDYTDVAPLLWPFAFSTSLLTLIGTYARYELATGSTSFVAPLVVGAALEVALLVLFHPSLQAVIGVLALTFSVTLIWLALKRLPYARRME